LGRIFENPGSLLDGVGELVGMGWEADWVLGQLGLIGVSGPEPPFDGVTDAALQQ